MKLASTVFLLGLIAALHSCAFNSEEDLYPNTGCDSTLVETYSTTITTLLQNNGCVGCHNTTFSSGSVNLDNYTDVKISVDNGSLLGSIKHEAPFKPMPQGSSTTISDCEIEYLSDWIAAGAPNN